MVIWLFCIICIEELPWPTWSWSKQSTSAHLLVFYLLAWIMNSKAPDATALHYAAGHNRIKCGGLLVEAGADLSARNKSYRTPLGIGSKRLEHEVKKTLSFAANRTIAVIDHAESGKSTLAALVAESKNWQMKVVNYFRKVRDISQRTTGIEPIKFSSQKYGETLFYDFAGQSQYHGPHLSFLEAMMNKPEVSVTLLLLVKATDEEDTIKQQFHKWLQPLAQMSNLFSTQVIVIGSYLDELKKMRKETEKEHMKSCCAACNLCRLSCAWIFKVPVFSTAAILNLKASINFATSFKWFLQYTQNPSHTTCTGSWCNCERSSQLQHYDSMCFRHGWRTIKRMECSPSTSPHQRRCVKTCQQLVTHSSSPTSKIPPKVGLSWTSQSFFMTCMAPCSVGPRAR